MSEESINQRSFELFLDEKKKKILKSINIDNKLIGIEKLDKHTDFIRIKAIYLWNNMSQDRQRMYINKIKKNTPQSTMNSGYNLLPV
jgi:hypothetical protein|tara:strand:- start:673 stop:933 length:261 start_codon:yes stop_codon:yes gene_type:complete